MRGLRASALAISTICRRDSGRSLTSASGWMSSAPARASASSAMRRCARRSIRPKRFGGLLMAMLSATVRSGISDSSWKMQTMPASLAAAGEAKRHLAAVQQHAALVGRDDAGHDLDQRRFAGAVLAEDGVDAAGLDRQGRRSPAPHAAIALGNAFHAEERAMAAHRLSRRQCTKCRGELPAAPARRIGLTGLPSVCPMISWAVKLMPQVGKELPTKKLSDWSGKKSVAFLEVRILDDAPAAA